MAETRKRLKDKRPKKPSELWDWLVKQKQDDPLRILAYCAAFSIDAVRRHADSSVGHEAQIAAALGLDMRNYWQPTSDSYFGVSRRSRCSTP